jgi:hypothetical protein
MSTTWVETTKKNSRRMKGPFMKAILYVVKIDYKEFTFISPKSAIEFAITALRATDPAETYNITIAFKLSEVDETENYETEKGGNQNASCI